MRLNIALRTEGRIDQDIDNIFKRLQAQLNTLLKKAFQIMKD